MDEHVGQAAKVLNALNGTPDNRTEARGVYLAEALAAAGLLLTEDARAVLDAAEAWRAADTGDSTYLQRCQSIYNLRMTTRRRKVAS